MHTIRYGLLFLVSLHMGTFLITSAALPTGQSIKLSVHCTQKGFCLDKHELYPQKLVDQLLNSTNMALVNPIQSKDENFKQLSTMTKDFASMSSLSQDIDGSEDDCKSTETMAPIYEILDKQGNMRIVVQSDKFQQALLIRECLNPGRITVATRHFSQETVDLVNLECVQQHIDYELYVLNRDWTALEIAYSQYGIPVDCYCRFS